MAKKNIQGVYVPVTTPFRKNETVDYKALASNIEYYASQGLAGCHVLGTNGENKSLSQEEKLDVLKTVHAQKNKMIVVAGCAFESTGETIAMAGLYASCGADYLTLMAPSYFKQRMTDRVLYRYFTDVASASPVPCIIYNAPQNAAGIILSRELVHDLSWHENIVALKDSSIGNIENYLEVAGDRIDVLAGSANYFLNALLAGSSGGIISLATVYPKQVLQLFELFSNKQYEEALRINRHLIHLNKTISGKYGVAGLKYYMDLVDLKGGGVRLPLLPLSRREKRELALLFDQEANKQM